MTVPRSPLVSLLMQRLAEGGGPPFHDGARVALCIEGGAMRGVVSGGMVTGLEQLGLTRCFDVVYGSSAGAMTGAYFLAGQAALGTTIYYQDINNRNFIDFGRPLRGKPLVDLDFLTGEVMLHRKPLDTARVIASPAPLVALATDAATGQAHTFRDFTGSADLRAGLRAGATMPIVAGGAYAYRGRDYFDALLTEPIPIATAEREQCTHILALLTRPHEPGGRGRMSWFERVLVGKRLGRVSPELERSYLGRIEEYARVLRQIEAGRGPAGDAVVEGIRPAGPVVGKLEREHRRLVDGARQGLNAVVRTFLGCDAYTFETVSAFDAQGHRIRVEVSQEAVND